MNPEEQALSHATDCRFCRSRERRAETIHVYRSLKGMTPEIWDWLLIRVGITSPFGGYVRLFTNSPTFRELKEKISAQAKI